MLRIKTVYNTVYKKLLVLANTKVVACLLASDFPAENPRPQTRNFPYTNTLGTMRKLTIFILTLTLNFGFSQTEKDDYEIYSLVINDIVKDWFDKPLNSILVVEQYEQKYKEDFSFINELTLDTIPSVTMDWFLRDSILRERFKKEKELKKVILDLTSDFENHPKIKTELLNLKGIQAQIITSEKYYSFHQRGNKYKKNGWKKIEKKFGTNLVFQLSKVKYNGNYASFYYSYHCGGLCASGNIIIMEKIKGEWKVLKGFELWVS